MSTRSDRPARTRPPLPSGPAVLVTSALLATLAATSADAASGDIYRTIQPDGTVVFTDRPAPDATLIESRPPDRVTVDPAAPLVEDVPTGEPTGGDDADRPSDARDAEAPLPLAADDGSAIDSEIDPLAAPGDGRDAMAGVPIERVEIASPPPDVTIVDPAGPLLVEIGTAPGSLAASGLVAEALVDGRVVATGTSSMIAVPAPERGEHRLGIRLVNAGGSVVVESEEQLLHVQRSIVRDALDEER